MGQQRPLDTLKGFVQTALRPLGGRWDYYYSRPAAVTKSYEARRYIARAVQGHPAQAHTEIFEYHWSYLMTGNRLGDLIPTTARLLVRRPAHVPPELLGMWRVAWAALVVLPLLVLVALGASLVLAGWPTALIWGSLGAVALAVGARVMGSLITASFVDVVRYLDTSPRSYAARRRIRGGLVDLLGGLHDDDRYSRIVVVAHSLGAYIAYDALSSLWAQTHEIHAGPPGPVGAGKQIKLTGLSALQQAADQILEAIPACPPEDPCAESARRLKAFQRCQYQLWLDLRHQGNPWRVTDFVSVGTPMYLADLLLTRPSMRSALRRDAPTAARRDFEAMMRSGELVRCPPRSETQAVEKPTEPAAMKYAWRFGSRQALGSQSLFAVVRWTNLWFPVAAGSIRGDFFGGPLQRLFGPGICDIAVQGNLPHRLARWGKAHTAYFKFPAAQADDDIAAHIRRVLDLKATAALRDLQNAPQPEARTATGPARRQPDG